MTKNTHTPGPWATDGREAGWNILGLAGERVATVWRDGPHRPAANARLIAAAPDLLAALEEFCRECDGYLDGNDGSPWGTLLKGRAAIAKATGQ